MAYNANTTGSAGLSDGMQTYYDKKMLMHALPLLVHQQFADKKALPANNGKTIDFRRWVPFAALTTPLVEGTIPTGQVITEENVSATVYQYGGYVTTTDLLDMTHLDLDLRSKVELMGEQGGLTVDTVVRDVMAGTTNVQYANSKLNIYTLLATDKMTVLEIRRAVRTLKNNRAPYFTSGGKRTYIAIVAPDTTFDIQDDDKWINVSTYSDKEQIYEGELGRLFGVRFVESTNEKKYTNSNLIAGQKYLTAASLDTLTITMDEAITVTEAAALVGRYLNVLDATDSTTYKRCLITAAAAGGAGAATVTVDDATTGFTIADNDICYAGEYGQNSNTVYETFIFGKHAYATIGITKTGGMKSDNMRTIVKTAKEIGGPLEQYSTVGWKVAAMAVVILQSLWIVGVHTGATDN